VEPKDTARGVVLGAVLNLAIPNAANHVPSDATVIGSETALVEAFTRLKDWLAGNGLRVDAEPMGAWWKIQVSVGAERTPPAVPGQDAEARLAALHERLSGKTVGVVLVTHGHPDHLPLAQRFASQFQASVLRHPELNDGDIVRAGTLNLTALYTPGHSADHLCF